MSADRTQAALELVRLERLRQQIIWGDDSIADGQHPYDACLRILVEEVGEVAQAINRPDSNQDMLNELTQVAAVAVAWIEGIIRETQTPDKDPAQ